MDVELTSSHLGYWELNLCPFAPATQDCFDKYPLQFAGGLGTKYNVTANEHESSPKYYSTNVQLPRHLKCERCQIQWNYRTGNECE